jgi:hypothetical protein
MRGLNRSVVLACSVLGACAPNESGRDIPPVVWSGQHLDFAPQRGAPEICSGTLPYMDHTVALVANVMDVDLDQPLVYVLGSELEDSFCEQEETLGCSFDDSVYSRVAPQEHELVHGVRGTQRFSHLFFEEGTAEVFGDDSDLALRVPANGDLMEGIETANGRDGLPSSWYPRAGHFVAFLHDRHGPEVTSALLRQTDAFSSAAQAVEECSMRCDSIMVDKPMGIELNAEPMFLRAGRYSVRLTRPMDVPGDVSLIVRGEDCE